MIFGMKKLTTKAVRGVLLFTVIEVVTLSAWLYYAMAGQLGVSVAILAGGLFVEHYIATQVGQQDK